jgi:hypothetical protein
MKQSFLLAKINRNGTDYHVPLLDFVITVIVRRPHFI